jgi:hypothetical protein
LNIRPQWHLKPSAERCEELNIQKSGNDVSREWQINIYKRRPWIPSITLCDLKGHWNPSGLF